MARAEDAGRRNSKGVAGRRLLGDGHNTGRCWPYLERWAPVLIVAILTILWEVVARAGVIPTLYFPPPSTIMVALIDVIASGEILPHLFATLRRLLLGFLLGGVPGLVLGLAMGGSRRLRVILDPLIAAAHPIPKIATLPLIMIVLGIGEASKVALIALVTFFPMVINTVAGAREIRPIYFEVAHSYEAHALRVLTRIVVPGSLPLILTGIRLAINIGLVITVALELVAATDGLGRLIWSVWQAFRIEYLYATLCVIAALGIGFNYAILWLSSRVVPWHGEQESPEAF